MLRHRPRVARGLVAALFLTFFLSAPIGQSPASAAVGDVDSALVLDGTKYASVNDTTGSAWDFSGNFTVEAWVYSTDCTNDSVIISKVYEFLLYCGGGTWKTLVDATGTSWTGTNLSSKAVVNEWHHVAISHSTTSTSLKFYYDGVNVETLTTSYTTIAANDIAVQIGGYSNGTSLFKGQIDELRVYNAQRSDAQVATDMNTYGPLNSTDLVAYYDMNDQSGTTINNVDASPATGTNMTMSSGNALYQSIDSSTVINGDQVVKFPRTYINANGGWKVPSYVSTVKSLVIGGGGAGGSRAGAGGGAGGYVYDTALAISPNSIQSIIVGTGGRGFLSKKGNNGTNSILGSLRTALGGGAGGTDNGPLADFFGNAGGSGGGSVGDYTTSPYTSTGGATIQSSTLGYGVGFAGGGGYAAGNWPSGGGGGAAGLGATTNSSSTGGNGGTGITDPIGGSSICYATGGGGGGGTSPGIGGNCGSGTTVNNNAGGPLNTTTWPGAATANTGSGGGGGSWSGSSDPVGGYGANGVIILRYALNMTVSLSYSGGTSATYRTVGTITATNNLPGKVTFYERGKAIPGCVRVSMNGSNVATCSWKPSLHGSTTITATAKPSNTYVPNGSTSLNLAVIARSNKR